MLLSNLSDGSCETKDVIIENEEMIRKLAELLVCIVRLYYTTSSVMLFYRTQQHPNTSIQLLVACVCIVRHLTRGDCHGKC